MYLVIRICRWGAHFSYSKTHHKTLQRYDRLECISNKTDSQSTLFYETLLSTAVLKKFLLLHLLNFEAVFCDEDIGYEMLLCNEIYFVQCEFQ